MGAGRRLVGAGRIDTGLVTRARPVISAREQVLPVADALAPLLPQGIRRGCVALVDTRGDAGEAGGATTLAVSLLAGASAAGSWCAVVGLGDPGVVAVAELGVDLDRLVLVPRPSAMWPEVVAVLLRGADLVLVCPPAPVRPNVARRLAARAREQRSALVVVARRGHWPEGPDIRLTVERGRWQGVEAGHGHLRARRATVAVTGRRAAMAAVRAELWLPGATGAVEIAGEEWQGEERCGGAEERCGEAVAGGVVPRSLAGRGTR
jgi:hypothetical protein